MHPVRLRLTAPGLLGLLVALTWLSVAPATTATEPLVFTVTPAASGEQLVRTSLPFPPGLFGTNALPQVMEISASATGAVPAAALRVLSLHPANPQAAPSVRRGLVSFVHSFKDRAPVRFELRPAPSSTTPQSPDGPPDPAGLPVSGSLRPDGVQLHWSDGTEIDLALIAPALSLQAGAARAQPRLEEVESSPLFRWQRLHVPDPDWPRVIEVRLDRQGTVANSAHLQRANTNGVSAPELGWEIQPRGTAPLEFSQLMSATRPPAKAHDFTAGPMRWCSSAGPWNFGPRPVPPAAGGVWKSPRMQPAT